MDDIHNPLSRDLPIDEIVDSFAFLDGWDDRYGYLIELGRMLKPLEDAQMNDTTKVQGCVSQVWLTHGVEDGRMWFRGASDAHIVRGLVAIALTLFSGREPSEVIATDERETFQAIGLDEHLTPQRANGLRAMVGRIKEAAAAAAV